MSEDLSGERPFLDYRPLGYVANPFAAPGTERDDPHWVLQITRAATNRLLVAADDAAAEEHPKPIWVSLGAEVPSYYVTIAENGFLRATGDDTTLNVLALNISLDMMKYGRIRGTLTELAELVAAVDFDLTLGAYTANVLADPDTALPEWQELSALDVAALARDFAAGPAAAVAAHFGELSVARRDDKEAEAVLFETYLRGSGQETDPEESDDSAEDDQTTVWTAPAQPHGDEPAEEEPEEAPAPARPVADYVVAHMRAHLSPVLARATRAYVSDGFSAVAQELKVTKAPKKTVAAIVRFATCRFRKVVFVYDHFDPWQVMDDETKAKVIGALSELRWAFGPGGVVVLLVQAGSAPELEEQFAAARRVEWDFPHIDRLYEGETAWDDEMVQGWLEAAALGVAPGNGAPDLAPLRGIAGDDVLRFAALASEAFAEAAGRTSAATGERGAAGEGSGGAG